MIDLKETEVVVVGVPNNEAVVAGVPKDFTSFVFEVPKFRLELIPAPKVGDVKLGVLFAANPKEGAEVVGGIATPVFKLEDGALAPKIGADVVVADVPKENPGLLTDVLPKENVDLFSVAVVSTLLKFEMFEVDGAFVEKEKPVVADPNGAGG